MDAGQKAIAHRTHHLKEEKEVLIIQDSPDRKLVRYLEELLRPHEYWDQKPTLKEGA